MSPKLPEDAGWCGDRKRGAGMGRGSTPGLALAEHKLYLRHIPLNRGGYDPGGAYWGLGERLYWACNAANTVEHFFRARDRNDAKRQMRDEYPKVKFFR